MKIRRVDVGRRWLTMYVFVIRIVIYEKDMITGAFLSGDLDYIGALYCLPRMYGYGLCESYNNCWAVSDMYVCTIRGQTSAVVTKNLYRQYTNQSSGVICLLGIYRFIITASLAIFSDGASRERC